MSETLPYIVLAGSVAAVFVGIGIKVALEGSSTESVLSAETPPSISGEALRDMGNSLSMVSEKHGVSVAEEGDVKTQHEVTGIENTVDNDGSKSRVVTAGGTESKKKRRRRVGKRLERKIVRLYKKGKSPKEIAEELGISTSTVYRKLKKITSVKR